MDDCCQNKTSELVALASNQRRVLWTVLLINLGMFFIEGGFSLVARSTSLFADSLDMLGDSFVYGISLFVIGKSTKWNTSVSLLKGIIMTLFGIGVLSQAVYRFLGLSLPDPQIMGGVGLLALTANFICAFLLLKHREDNINMRSTWLCSRNDVIANLSVLGAAAAVSLTQSKLPDLLVGSVIAALVLHSSYTVLRESVAQLRIIKS